MQGSVLDPEMGREREREGKDATGREMGLENGGGRERERIETEAGEPERGRGARGGRESAQN